MGIMTIDGRKVEFTDERNVLTVIRKAGIDIPTLCYHSELSTFGACRLCTVEDDRGKTFASCSEEPRDGMVIYTNTAKLPVNVFFPFHLPIQISGNNRKSFFSLFNIFFYSGKHF